MPRPIQEILDELKLALASNVEVRETNSLRNVAKKAKNIALGEVVNLPGFGPTEVHHWSRSGGMVIIGNNKGINTAFPEEYRVTVVRNNG